ncbi:MAG: choice-of-anchor H family protein, partial [Pseudomonadota bacterium]
KRGKTSGQEAQQKVSASPTVNDDFWFYDATVDLFADTDNDGYYFGIDLMFDADTLYSAADVYAVIYLSYELGPWNEYAETETFTIFGASGTDEYTVESELISGYPTGEYDILIELFDAFDDSFVASIGPDETSELAFLPLEDAGRDTPPVETQVVVNTGSGGGSLGWIALLALAGIAARRRRA